MQLVFKNKACSESKAQALPQGLGVRTALARGSPRDNDRHMPPSHAYATSCLMQALTCGFSPTLGSKTSAVPGFGEFKKP